MNKSYSRINWENYPSDATPLNEANLNRIDSATDVIDNRVIELDTNKASKTDVAETFVDVAFDSTTGEFKFKKKNGSIIVVNTLLEKVVVNFTYDPQKQQLNIVTEDGKTTSVDLSSLVSQYEFSDTETISFYVTPQGKVQASVKTHSINDEHLRTDYLSDIKIASASAEKSASDSFLYSQNADASKNLAEQYMNTTKGYLDNQEDILAEIDKKINMTEFSIDNDGNLVFTENAPYIFSVDDNGNLNWEVE